MFFGLGSDGTVGANKNTIKILGDAASCTPRATSSTTRRSQARRPSPICGSGRSRSTRRIWSAGASFVGCHQFGLLERVDVLGPRRAGRDAAAQRPHDRTHVWDALPRPVQEQIVDKHIDALRDRRDAVAREAGLPGRTNTVLQTCFFAISGVLPRDEAIAADQGSDREDLRPPRRRGRRRATSRRRPRARGLHHIEVPGQGNGHAASSRRSCRPMRPTSSAR